MKVKVVQVCPTCNPMDYSPSNSPGQNTGVSSLSFLQGIFPTQGLNPGLPHCRQILYQLNHKGSPRLLEWVVYPFSRRSSWHRNKTGVSFIESRFFTNWAIRKAIGSHKQNEKTTGELEEDICKWWYQQRVSYQNMQTTHTTQWQKLT